MPKFIEDKLKAEAAKEGKTGRAADRYIYGTMNKIGAMKGNQETDKGRAMERKHEQDQARSGRMAGTHKNFYITEHHRTRK